jgi:hypothetical protein
MRYFGKSCCGPRRGKHKTKTAHERLDGTVCLDPKGNDYYWEHWGLLDKSKYTAHTVEKQKWYEKHFPGLLIESVEGNDISIQIKDICQKKFGMVL